MRGQGAPMRGYIRRALTRGLTRGNLHSSSRSLMTHFGGFSMSSRQRELSVKEMCEYFIPSSLYYRGQGSVQRSKVI